MALQGFTPAYIALFGSLYSIFVTVLMVICADPRYLPSLFATLSMPASTSIVVEMALDCT